MPDAAHKIVEAVTADPVVQAAVEHVVGADPRVAEGARASVVATESETSLRTEGQRKINLIWEATQALVTILVVASTLFIAGSLVLSDGDEDNRAAAFLLLSNAFFMIVTAYYQRTNHTRTGGVGGTDVRSDR